MKRGLVGRCHQVQPLATTWSTLRPMTAEPNLSLFASSAPGLEGHVARELARLEVNDIEERAGGVAFTGGLADAYKANLWLGTATHVLVRLGAFKARQFTQFTRKLERVEFSPWLKKQPVHVRVSSKRSRLYHTKAIAERTLEVLGAKAASEGEVAPRVVVRFLEDECEISFDTSGEALHRRGYRLQTGKAPLRPDLAHALLLSSGWDGISDLIDPFVGAGTVLIEAAKLAAGRPPGDGREFAFSECPNFDSDAWTQLKTDTREVNTPSLLGCDRDAGVIEAAKANAERAAVLDRIQFEKASISDCAKFRGDKGDAKVWIVSDPPYGGRTKSSKSLLPLYQRFGKVVNDLSPRWNVGLVLPNDAMAKSTGLPLKSKLMTDRGGRKVRFFVGAAAQ